MNFGKHTQRFIKCLIYDGPPPQPLLYDEDIFRIFQTQGRDNGGHYGAVDRRGFYSWGDSIGVPSAVPTEYRPPTETNTRSFLCSGAPCQIQLSG